MPDGPTSAPRARKPARGLSALICLILLPTAQTELRPAGARPAPRNGRIAFQAVGNLPNVPNAVGPFQEGFVLDTDLFTVLPNGSALERLTEGPEIDGGADWSPDGSAIAFWRSLPLIDFSDIWVLRNGVAENLTNTPNDYDYAPDWSPGGTEIAFDSDRVLPTDSNIRASVSGFDVYVMDSTGGDPHLVVGGLGNQSDPAWSPDGSWIAYADFVNGVRAIAVVRPDGTGQRTIVTRDAARPEWSPDGTRLVFSRAGDIWVVKADGRRQEILTPRTSSNDFGAAWSPDGKRIVFVSDRDGAYRLFTMKANGTDVKRLIDIDVGSSNYIAAVPSWGPR